MPASRKARAIIFAPRSWPSRPGLAINTRIFFCVISEYHYAMEFAKRCPSVCQAVVAGRVSEFLMCVPLRFGRFGKKLILAGRLARTFQHISAWPIHRAQAAFTHLGVFCGGRPS